MYNHNDREEEGGLLLSPPCVSVVDKFLQEKSSSCRGTTTSGALPKNKRRKVDGRGIVSSTERERIIIAENRPMTFHNEPRKRKRSSMSSAATAAIKTIRAATSNSTSSNKIVKKRLTALIQHKRKQHPIGRKIEGSISFPIAMNTVKVAPCKTQSNQVHHGKENQHSYTLPFEVISTAKPSSTLSASLKSLCGKHFVTHQVINLPSSSSSSLMRSKSWPLTQLSGEHERHHNDCEGAPKLLSTREYEFLFNEIKRVVQSKNQSRHCDCYTIRQQLQQDHQQADVQKDLSLSTLNIMLLAMNAGLLLYNATELTPNEWWMLLPDSISQSKLFPLSFSSSVKDKKASFESNKGNVIEPQQMKQKGTNLDVSNVLKSQEEANNVKYCEASSTSLKINAPKSPCQSAKPTSSVVITDLVSEDTIGLSSPPDGSNDTILTAAFQSEHAQQQIINDFHLYDYKSNWLEVVRCYQDCLINQQPTAVPNFAKNQFQLAIKKLLQLVFPHSTNGNEQEKLNEKDLTTKSIFNKLLREKSSCSLLSLFNASKVDCSSDANNSDPNDNGYNPQHNQDTIDQYKSETNSHDFGGLCVAMLMTRVELLTFIKNRHKIHAKFIQSESVDDVVSSHDDEENSFCRRLLELQIFIRLELYCTLYPQSDRGNKNQSADDASLASDHKDALKNLRASYGIIVAKEKTKKARKGKKKILKRNHDFTSENFVTEICSVIELVPFIMSNSTESFTDFVVKSIIAPYRSYKISSGIQDHFEIEMESNHIGESDEDKEHFVLKDDKSTQKSLEIVSADKGISNNTNGGKEEKRASSPDQSSNEAKDSKRFSRWDSLNVHKESVDKVGRCANDRDDTQQEKASMVTNNRLEPSKAIDHSPKLFFQRDIKIQLPSHNPLLANGRGKYVGRHLGNHNFNEVKILRSSDSSLKSKGMGVTSGSPNSEITNTSNSETVSRTSETSRRERLNPVASLGSAASLYRGNSTKQKVLHKKEQRTESNERSAINSNRHGAALLAARARRYLRTKTTGGSSGKT